MAHQPRPRTIIGPDGTPHIRYGARPDYLHDLYHYVMRTSWLTLAALLAVAFTCANLTFALAYLLAGGLQSSRPGHFSDDLFFSVQTMATIGSATVKPHSLLANLLLCIEVQCGLTGFALITGLAFAKFTRPTSRVRFSRFAVVSNRHGIPSLMFRMANQRENQLLEAQVHVVLIRSEITEEGESVRRFYDLELLRDRNVLFALSWTAIHPITGRSPLFGTKPDSLVAQHAVIVVSLTGLDETLLQTVPARHAYLAKDIVFGARFADILTPIDGGSLWMIDSSHFDEVQPASLTSVQSTSVPASPPCYE